MLIDCPQCGKWVFTNSEKCTNCGCPRDAWIPEHAKLPAPAENERSFVMGAWGGEPIEWRVLGVGDDHLFAISVCRLDCVKFNETYDKGSDWKTSDLKAWLEQTFLPRAFSDDERARIDEITCLSSLEAELCFANNKDRLCTPTEYAEQRGAFRYRGSLFSDEPDHGATNACHWWLRSAGTVNGKGAPCAAEVGVEGLVFELGWPVDSAVTAVRPAIWVKR